MKLKQDVTRVKLTRVKSAGNKIDIVAMPSEIANWMIVIKRFKRSDI